jgi:hypothetical protein
MIIEEIKDRSISADLTQLEILSIKSYLQGAIYCWCKNCKNDNNEPTWFSASDLFGGDNYYWEGTPLYEIYKWHEEHKADDPVNMAGKDVGHLLRDVLKEDKRTFHTKKEYTRKYLWDGKN